MLRAIKLVKMYAWEDKFADGVAAERRKEDSIADAGGILKVLGTLENYTSILLTKSLCCSLNLWTVWPRSGRRRTRLRMREVFSRR